MRARSIFALPQTLFSLLILGPMFHFQVRCSFLKCSDRVASGLSIAVGGNQGKKPERKPGGTQSVVNVALVIGLRA